MAGPTPGSEAPNSSSAADEALKRNTDCVYFLASPLTCKKGSECEYRHSEVARVNPRDCYYWLHGNCLNPKCAFRHPPLDGLLGTQTPTSAGPSLPLTQNVPTLTAHVPNASNKPGVPCIFFQKGFCLKGDWCPFLHGPNSMSNKGSLMPETASASEAATFRKVVGDKKVVPINVVKPVKESPLPKSAVEVERGLIRNEFPINKRMTHTSGVNEFSGYKNLPSVANGNPRVQPPYPLDEPGSMNYKDAEEVSREPSPGFDVLVDDERRDSDYYHSEDQYGISREHEVRNEYNIGRPIDYDTEIGSERYQDPRGYDSREHFKGQHAREHRDIRSNSLERMSGGSSYLERRPYARKDSQVEELDLRHRLAKHKKSNGLRSVINHEHARDRHAEDRSYQRFHREEHVSRGENSFGSRLRGRLRIPGRSSSPTDKDIIGSRNQGRLSPVRAASSHHGRIRDRIKGNVEESFSSDGKNHRDLHLRRHTVDDNSANFAAPKSLAELKNKKNTEHSRPHVIDQLSLGKRKHLMLDGNEQSGDDLSFEGPKPLQEILKRKKGETIGVAAGRNSSNNDEIAEDNKAQESVNKTETEHGRSYGRLSAPTPAASKEQAEDGIITEDGEYQETEAAYEQREGESDYEQAGGEEFEMYDGENGDAEGEEEYHDEDDDDDDDFAKKMGVMYSEA